MKKRVDLQLWHESCWMLDISRSFGDAELVVTDICSDGTDILATVVVSVDRDMDLTAIEQEAAEHAAVRSSDVLETGDEHLRIHTRYDASASIYTSMMESSLTPIGEIRVADDREQWTLIADGDAIGESIARLESYASVDVSRVVNYEPSERSRRDVIDEISRGLSDRQRLYLLSALDEGYYSWPRGISASELAERHDVAGPTALEHLRKGEALVLQHLLSQLRERERETVTDF